MTPLIDELSKEELLRLIYQYLPETLTSIHPCYCAVCSKDFSDEAYAYICDECTERFAQGKEVYTIEELIAECREIIECDTARISKPDKRMFLIIGFRKNTKNDEGEWIKNNKRIDFDYVKESVVASGETAQELIESAREYKRLSNYGKYALI